MKIYMAVTILCFLFSACDNDSQIKVGESTDSLAQDIAVDSLQVEFDKENAPEWFNSISGHDKIIIARGYGKSRRTDIAEEKAMMNAQLHLQSLFSDDSSTSTAEHESIQIAPYKIKHKKRVHADNYWHVYVLLEKTKQ